MDPREILLSRPRLGLLVFLGLWSLFAIGNVLTPKGAILEDALVNENDPHRKMDDYVTSRLDVGFRGQADRIPFVLYFDKSIHTVADLRRIRDFSESVLIELGTPVASLSSYPHFVDDGEEISSDSHIGESLPDDFDIEAWKQRVRNDASVYGTLVGRDFDYAIVVWFLQPGADEVATFRRVAEFIEKRPIPAWEWLYKTDIDAPPNLGVGSRVVLDGLIDQGMNVDVFLLVGVGIGLTFPVFVFAFRAFPPALLAVFVVVLSGILWTRGSIGILAWLGIPIKERVYCLLAYANCIVQGVSFTLHKYESFYESIHDSAGEPGRPSDRASFWRRAREIDGLVGFAALVGVLGFATLYWFEVRAIRESGVVSAIGVTLIFFNATVILPALDTLVMRHPVGSGTSEPRVERSLDWLSNWVGRLAPRHGIAILTTAVLSALLLVGPANRLSIWTKHLDFAGQTVVRHTSTYMNAPARSGFDVIDLLVEPADRDGTIRDPRFLAATNSFLGDVRRLDGTREISTIMTAVERVSSELLDRPLPKTVAEASAVINTIDGGLDRALATNLYHQGGVRVSLHTAIERSDRIGAYIDSVFTLATDKFPEIRVSAYGGRALYPRWDGYIRFGKPLNVLSSQWIVVILFMLRIAWHNRHRRADTSYLNPLLGGLLASVPFVFATSALVFLMVGVPIPLDAATASITALVINAAIDFSIYLVDEFQRGLATGVSAATAAKRAVNRKGRVILADMTLNGLCATPLLLSRFTSLQHVGYIMPFMVAASAFGTLVVMTTMLPLGVRGLTRDAEAGAFAPSDVHKKIK